MPKRILIAVSTCERRRTTAVSLANLSAFSLNADIIIWDDCSQEYSGTELEPYAKKVFRSPKRIGIHALRGLQIKFFLEDKQYERLYFTDSDVAHDPNWQCVAERLLLAHGHPVCLYNTRFHTRGAELPLDGLDAAFLRKTCPGVSLYLKREMVEEAVNALAPEHSAHWFSNWDGQFMNLIASRGHQFTHSQISYLEHFGAGGIHNADNFRDTANYPTPYLKEARDRCLPYLHADAVSPPPELIRFLSQFSVPGHFSYQDRRVQQNPQCLPVFALFLKLICPCRIIELGTGGGGFTLLLHDILKRLTLADRCEMVSVDALDSRSYRRLVEVGIRQIMGDLNDPELQGYLREVIGAPGLSVVLCDGGNKRKDFCIFAPFLKPGDYILAHDYAESLGIFNAALKERLWNWCEITESDIHEISRDQELEDFLPLLFSPIAWVCKRKARPGNS